MTRCFILCMALALSGCQHQPLRPIGCLNVLGLRQGQTPDDVRARLGPPAHEGEYRVFWEDERVADYGMWYRDPMSGSVWDSYDQFYIEFFKEHLIVVRAYRYGELFRSPEQSHAVLLGLEHYGKRGEPVRAELGPAFTDVFRCEQSPEVEAAKQRFVAQSKQ